MYFIGRIRLKGEYARSWGASKTGYGWHLQVSGTFRKADIHASYLAASPDFAGYYAHTNFFTSHVNYRITPRFSAHANVQQDARNFQRDTLFGASPYREHVQLGLRYTYWRNGTIGVHSGLQGYEDRNRNQQFHYDERFIRIDLNQQLANWGINLQSHLAETRNHLTHQTGSSFNHSAYLHYRRRNTYFNVFGSYSELSRYHLGTSDLFQYGGRIHSVIDSRWDIAAFYQNAYHLEDYYADRNLFELSIQYKPSASHVFKIVSRYALAQLQTERKDFSLLLRYTFSLRVPVKKVKEYGRLAGHITNHTQRDLTDLRLRLGQQMALVDPNGQFSFRNVPPGTCFLELDPGSLGMKTITDLELPALIDIQEGDNSLAFGVTHSAVLHGRIALMGLLLTAGSPARSQTITITPRNWHIPENPITEAGSDYSGTVTNPNNLILSGNIPGSSLLRLLESGAVDITVRFTPNQGWHESLSLYGKRTGGSATIGGICLLCSVSITGGETYIQIPKTADVPLLSITFSGTLVVGNSITFSNILVQLELRGLSVVTPVEQYGADVVFTIDSP